MLKDGRGRFRHCSFLGCLEHTCVAGGCLAHGVTANFWIGKVRALVPKRIRSCRGCSIDISVPSLASKVSSHIKQDDKSLIAAASSF